MLLANETVAEFLDQSGVPGLYRVHEEPDPLKVAQFEEFISSLGYSLAAPPHGLRPFLLGLPSIVGMLSAHRYLQSRPMESLRPQGSHEGVEVPVDHLFHGLVVDHELQLLRGQVEYHIRHGDCTHPGGTPEIQKIWMSRALGLGRSTEKR